MVKLENASAKANPTKRFFVLMITRDISLEDCILDLIDNSVDSAWHSEGSRPMGLAEDADLSAYTIQIEAYPDRFVIRDNCGGMTLTDAVEHAFSFGRKATEQQSDYSIGVYGIGMKRAVFKIGADIRVRSTFTEGDGKRLGFAVPINVVTWLNDDVPPWDFDIVDDELLDQNGVQINVGSLTEDTKSSFDSPAFIQNLRRTVARDYSLHMSRGLKIEINGKPVEGWQLDFRQSDDFSPVRIEYKDEVNGEPVAVELIGGMTSAPPESNDPDETAEGDRRHGWYVICNGRIVLAADKTAVTGWGTEDWPQWHQQYSGFIGVILFTAAKASALPLTTTKRSVDQSAGVFRRARPRMRDISRQWIKYTNQRKQALEEAKAIEARAEPVRLQQVRNEPTLRLPDLVIKLPREPMANVHYSVTVARMKRLAKEFGNINLTYREVGVRAFDYTYADLVGED